MEKEEIEKAKEKLKYLMELCKELDGQGMKNIYWIRIKTILDYIEQLETKVTKLEETDLTSVYLDGVYDGQNKEKERVKELEEEKQKVIDNLKLWIKDEELNEQMYEDKRSITIAHKRKLAFKTVLNLYNKGDNNENR